MLFERFPALSGGFVAGAGTKNVQSNFNTLHECGGFLNGRHETAANGEACVFDSFESAGKDAIGVDELAADAVGSIGDDAIHFVGLAAGEIDDLGSVFDEGGKFGLGVVQKKLGAGHDGTHAGVQIGDHAIDGLGGLLHFEEKTDQDRDLNDQGDGLLRC